MSHEGIDEDLADSILEFHGLHPADDESLTTKLMRILRFVKEGSDPHWTKELAERAAKAFVGWRIEIDEDLVYVEGEHSLSLYPTSSTSFIVDDGPEPFKGKEFRSMKDFAQSVML